MKREGSSLTALGIAAVRALEAERKPGDRVCYDPYARSFLPTWFYYLVKIFTVTGYAEWRGPGVQGFLVARVRYIDDYLKQCVNDGIGQLVILGAGFDSRAYRFGELLKGIKVIEVDHPATQATKKKKLVKILGELPNNLLFISMDFTKDALEEALPKGGYDESAKTLFIWEGVTEYLNLEAVKGTLSFIVKHSGPESSVIFDYIYKSVLEGRVKHGEVSSIRRNKFISGEALTFGIEEGEAGRLLQSLGFKDIVEVEHEYLEKTYFTGNDRRVAPGYAIVYARVHSPKLIPN